jgi:uncharacterized protein (UPF0335 family)
MTKKILKKKKGPKLSNSGAQIKSIIERWERLAEEKAAITEDQKEIMAEAKSNGFDTKIIRLMIARRKRDAAELAEQEALMDTYWGSTYGFEDED